MSSERTRSYLTRVGSRTEADVKDNDPDKAAASGAGSSDRSWYSGYRTVGEHSSHGPLRKSGLSAPAIAHRENNSLTSSKRNGLSMSAGIGSATTNSSTTSTGSSSTSSTRSTYSSSTYIPIGKRLQNPYLSESGNGPSPANSLDSGSDKVCNVLFCFHVRLFICCS